MTTTMTAASSGTDLISMLAKAANSLTPGIPGTGDEFASQLISAQSAAGGAPSASPQPATPSLDGQAPDVQPQLPETDLPQELASAQTLTPGLAVESDPEANPAGPPAGIAAPPAGAAESTGPDRPALPAPSTSPAVLSSASESSSQGLPVVSAGLPAAADTTTPASPVRHSGPRHASDSAAPATSLPVLSALPAPVTAAGGIAPQAATALDTDADDADAAGTTSAAAATAGAISLDSSDPAPRPVSARSHVSASSVTAAAASFSLAIQQDPTATVSAAHAVGDQSRQSDSNPTPSDADSVTAAIDASAAVAAPATVSSPATLTPTPAAIAPAPLQDQLAKPIFTLRTAPAGNHVMTIRVAPEAIGPVTVRAHISSGGIQVQLIAPTDESSAALNAILPDLKRDLAQGGMDAALTLHQHAGGDASLDFGSQGQASQGQPGNSATADFGGRGARDQSPVPTGSFASSATADPAPASTRTITGDASLDVLA